MKRSLCFISSILVELYVILANQLKSRKTGENVIKYTTTRAPPLLSRTLNSYKQVAVNYVMCGNKDCHIVPVQIGHRPKQRVMQKSAVWGHTNNTTIEINLCKVSSMCADMADTGINHSN